MSDLPPVIAVIGPVEPHLLRAWTEHYRSMGVERFVLALHFPSHVPAEHREALRALLDDLGIVPQVLSTGPWHEDTNTRLRDSLRRSAGPGWHLIADSDEFQAYPDGLAATLASARRSGRGVVGGLMLDRVAADGALAPWTATLGLDSAYPLGGFLTHRLLRGDPRKVVLAHSGIDLASGNHRASGHRPANRCPVVVHHFKWRRGVREDLERRVHLMGDGTWRTQSQAVPSEAYRLLNHLGRNGGRLATGGPVLYRPVSLTRTPDWWADESTRLVATWRPPAAAGPSIAHPARPARAPRTVEPS